MSTPNAKKNITILLQIGEMLIYPEKRFLQKKRDNFLQLCYNNFVWVHGTEEIDKKG